VAQALKVQAMVLTELASVGQVLKGMS